MKLDTVRVLKNIFYIGGGAAALITWFLPDGCPSGVKTGLLIAACTLVVVGFVVTLLFYRCPKCKHNFPVNEKLPDVCPNCGEPLQK